MEHTFQVDLRGVVDLLSHHLYRSPRVYVRELLQNAVDAITARRARDPHAPTCILIDSPDVTGDGSLRVRDTGIGLSEAEMHELLATIGCSSKRDELGFARHEFLGQFGIGLLSCFLVADEIRVESRATGFPTMCWTGHSDGTYSISGAPTPRPEVGTTVVLLPRRDMEQWLSSGTVADLARTFGSLLPYPVVVDGVAVNEGVAPWAPDSGTDEPEATLLPAADPGRPAARGPRHAALIEYAERNLGFTPFEVIDLSVPAAGLTGAAFVLPAAANPAARAAHRVYLKRMLLSDAVDGLLPDWAFFVRCVVDTTELAPTASREGLYDSPLLAATREELGRQLREFLLRLARTEPRRLGEFLEIHHLGVKALALFDDEMLRLVDRWWPMETNFGRMTLAEFRSRFGLVRYTARMEEFRQLAAVAAAQNLPMVNGGYTYDTEIIERLPLIEGGGFIERVEPGDLVTRFDSVDRDTTAALRPFLATAQRAMDHVGCDVVLRSFDPVALPAIYLVDRSAAFAQQWRATRATVDETWGGVLDALAVAGDDRPRLVLNHRNPLVRRITAVADDALVTLAVEALYGQALLLGYHPVRPADAALLNSSFLGLLSRAVPGDTAANGETTT